MEEAVVRRILAMLNISFVRIEPPSKGYRNSSFPVLLPNGQRLNVIVYKREPGIVERIRRADAASAFLAERGLPTRVAHSDIIKLNGTNGERYARIYNYLPGVTIPWEAYTMKHLKSLGRTLAIIHATLHEYSNGRSPSIIAESRSLSKRMAVYFASPGVRQALRQKLGLAIEPSVMPKLDFALASPDILALPSQTLHMDFVRGNILFKPGTPDISGIIDFEKTSHGPKIFDLARTLAFLLVDCKYKEPAKVRQYFIASGYIKHGGQRLSGPELRLLTELTRFYLIHDFYKFLKHNPYEALHANQHFLRTRDFLLKDGIIKQTKLEELTDANLEGAL